MTSTELFIVLPHPLSSVPPLQSVSMFLNIHKVQSDRNTSTEPEQLSVTQFANQL